MTTIYLTDEDYAVIATGDPDKIKAHFNQVRGELLTMQQAMELIKFQQCQMRQNLNAIKRDYVQPED